MTSPTEQRRAFDAAMERYKSGDTARALTAFTQITAAHPPMSDAWLGRMACGDNAGSTLAAAHHYSRALYRETRRIGLNDGELHAQIAAPLYLTVPVWSRATIGLAYAGALIAAGATARRAAARRPDRHRRHQAAQWRQFIKARPVTTRPAAGPTCVRSPRSHRPRMPPTCSTAVTAAVASLSAAAAASLGQFRPPWTSPSASAAPTPYVAADARADPRVVPARTRR